MEKSFLTELDEQRLNDSFTQVAENVTYYDTISEHVISTFADSLDTLMKTIYDNIISKDSPSIESIEKYYLELTNFVYFMGDKVEKLGVYDDLSKTAAKEVYNNAYIENQTRELVNVKSKPTVAENQVFAEEESKYQSIVNSIYARAYKVMKFKIDAAQEMIRTLSKVLSKHMQEQQLSGSSNIQFERKTLNEDIV